MSIIYGIDDQKIITPLMVRDAMLECFYQAHCEASSLGIDDASVNREYCHEIVRKMFSNIGGNFDQPTKQDILKAIEALKTFSQSFRKPEIIKKHVVEIMKLVDKLK
ncbi:MAG: hypothetical protein JW816_02955 [Candidatus Buchananbacteria bacterium]|nr:hypothetical protein [Candidatus Buchananbacteria bacterium]